VIAEPGGTIRLRDMESGEQRDVAEAELPEIVIAARER
jgi:hypothetical protein